MIHTPLHPLRFEPICQYRPWGGRRLAHWLQAPLPGTGPIGEAWLLSDRDDFSSQVAEGPLRGRTIGELIRQSPEQLLGKGAMHFRRFPLLLKFLDARDTLSVQVHPSDGQTDYLPPGESGKTESWVVLEADVKSRIYAGLHPDTTPDDLRRTIASGTVADRLASFQPESGDAVLLPAGTVHALGGTVVFEVQQNSDVTFRLFDWNHVDAETGQPRPLQVDAALACLDIAQGAVGPVTPTFEEEATVRREQLVRCEHFGMWRLSGDLPFVVGVAAAARVLVGLAGHGRLEYQGLDYPVGKGEVVLLPAEVGACTFCPEGPVTLLEISLPEGKLATW